MHSSMLYSVPMSRLDTDYQTLPRPKSPLQDEIGRLKKQTADILEKARNRATSLEGRTELFEDAVTRLKLRVSTSRKKR